MRPSRRLFLRIARLPPDKLILLLEAAFWLCVARLAILLIPFPRIGRYIGKLQQPTLAIPDPAGDNAAIARTVASAVRACAINAPIEMVCLPQALAAWQMLHLRRVASRLHFGLPIVRQPGDGRQMHAWLSSSGVEVTGYPVARDCVEVGFFSRREEQVDKA